MIDSGSGDPLPVFLSGKSKGSLNNCLYCLLPVRESAIIVKRKERDIWMSSFLTVQDVCKYYGTGEQQVIAADHISFSIEAGEFAVILGHSGAGKTTLLNILGGMDTCDAGKVVLDGSEISALGRKKLTEYRRYDVGFVFQFYNLVQNLSALENVELASEICREPLSARSVLCDVGLADRMDHFPAQLSGGEQQRVAIARALAKNPKLLLCDEPTGALDYKTGKSILALLQDTCNKTGKTVIVITHNQAIAAMADRVIHLRSGRVESVRRNEHPLPVDQIEW